MEGWATVRLGDVCEIKPPKKEASEKLSSTDLVSFVPMECLGVCSKNINLKTNKPLAEVQGSYTYFADNDVLLAKITPCFENGKLGIAKNLTNGIGFGSSEYVVFRSKGTIVPEYLFHFLSQDTFRENGARVMTGAVGHKRVPKKFIEDHPIPLPPIEEQRRIVAVLDDAFAAIAQARANAQRNHANARELFDITLNHIFANPADDWDTKTLGEVCVRLHQGLNTAGEKINFANEGYPIIQTRNINGGKIDLTEKIKFTCEKDWLRFKDKYRPEIGDVFFTNIGTIGKTAIVEEDQNYLIHWNIFKIRPDFKELDSYYLKYFLDFLTSSDYFKALQKGGTVDFVTKKMIEEASIFIPTLAIQKDMVKRLNALAIHTQQLQSIYHQKQQALDELKQALLHQAFTGQLATHTLEKTLHKTMEAAGV